MTRTERALELEMNRLERVDFPSGSTANARLFLDGAYQALRWAKGETATAPSGCAILAGKKWTRKQQRKSAKFIAQETERGR